MMLVVEGVMERAESQRQSGGGRLQTDPDQYIYSIYVKIHRKTCRIGENSNNKQQKYRKSDLTERNGLMSSDESIPTKMGLIFNIWCSRKFILARGARWNSDSRSFFS